MAPGSLVDSLVDLVTLELLEQVAHTGSLTAGAAAIGISQQAASARIRRMERLLGHRLVTRSASGSALTEQGGVILEWAAPVLDAARRAALSMDALRYHDAPLTVAASQTIAEFLLPTWLQTLRRSDPQSVVRLVSGNSAEVVDRVRSGVAQLGFVEGPTVPDDLHSVAIDDDELVVVVAPDDPWADGPELDAHALADRPLLLRERGSGTRATFEQWLADRGIAQPAPAAELGTTSAIRAAALAGVAPAVLSRRAVRDDLIGRRLVEVPLLGDRPARRFTAIWSASDPGVLVLELIRIAGSSAERSAPRPR